MIREIWVVFFFFHETNYTPRDKEDLSEIRWTCVQEQKQDPVMFQELKLCPIKANRVLRIKHSMVCSRKKNVAKIFV